MLLESEPQSLLLEDLLAEQGIVQQVRHETVGRAQIGARLDGAADDRADAVEPSAAVERDLRQLVRGHVLRDDAAIVEAIVLVEPPAAVVQQPVLAFGNSTGDASMAEYVICNDAPDDDAKAKCEALGAAIA